ncbi:hypothetical protein [Rossellomorea marisflavi]|uniref:hypothetical protein n=1 Tax=Rossellomorea marisflavi TaxID=189381 RepID=UPI003FA00BA8
MMNEQGLEYMVKACEMARKLSMSTEEIKKAIESIRQTEAKYKTINRYRGG